MAECSYARCVQERRAIKKELQRWTKNMVFVVGLERVAEELMGRRKWRQYQDVVLRSPLTAVAEPDAADWEPQDKCCFCDGGSYLGLAPKSPASDSSSSSNSRSSFRESPPVSFDGHSSSAAHVSPSPATMTTLESVTSMAASLAAVAALSVNTTNTSSATGASANPSTAGSVPVLPPSHPHSGLFSPWYMSPPPPHLAPNLRLDTVAPASKQESPIPAVVMSLPASTASEQPLDLSAKATSCSSASADDSSGFGARSPTPDPSLKVPSVLDKHIFKAKPRMSAVAGRRQYTEEELQAALRDIQSGKLGTRRAAVIYGIPRSTLRNKVYKLAMERERDSHLNPIALVDKGILPPVVALKDEDEGKDDDDDDKELSGAEEEREVEKALRKPLLSMEDLIRFSMMEGGSLAAAESLQTLLQHGKLLEEKHRSGTIEREDGTPSPTLPSFPSTADIWQGLEHSALGPFISQILAASGGQSRDFLSGVRTKNLEGGIATSPRESSPTSIVNDFLPKFPSPLPDLVRRMMAEDEHMRKSRLGAHQPDVNFLVNGAHPEEAFVATDEKGKMGKPPGLPSPSATSRSEASKGEAEDLSDADAAANSATSGMATPPNVILKIPSFKPTSKNGVAASGIPSETLPFAPSAFTHANLTPESSQHLTMSVSLGSGGSRSNHSDSCSPPMPNLVGKGIGVSLRDVIAKSISQKFQQQGGDISHLPLSQKLLLPPDGVDQPLYKRGRFTPPIGCNPPPISASVIKHNNNNTHSDDKNAAQKMAMSTTKPATSGTLNTSSSTSGKGTRPKRGKYRNYDRDSLVEAVRAVQRGEMSVHRAGSYYGVPHSTLEYKVKERHLMRPRKREQKSQLDVSKPKDDNIINKSTPATTANIAATPSVTVIADKLKTPPKASPKPFAPNSPLPAAPNGLKIPPLFDPTISHLAYTTPPPFPFWPPTPFHPSIPIPDFTRSGNAAGGFSPGSEHFFASQMMQRLQEESSRVHGNSSPGVSSTGRSPPVANASNALGRSAREMAESLYDGTGANGSFLDGIIRSSLEMGIPPGALKDGIGNPTGEKVTAPENLSNKALLDQLCRNSRVPPVPRPGPQGHTSSYEDTRQQQQPPSSASAKSAAGPAAVVDLSSSGSGADSGKEPKPTDEEERAPSPKANNTKENSSDTDDGAKSHSKETNGLSNANDDPNDNVSACDSMSNLKRVSDIDAAKDLVQGGGSEDPQTQQEDTKSNTINS